jgi:hypothetical protein
MVFWVVIPYFLELDINVSEENAAVIFRIEVIRVRTRPGYMSRVTTNVFTHNRPERA